MVKVTHKVLATVLKLERKPGVIRELVVLQTVKR